MEQGVSNSQERVPNAKEVSDEAFGRAVESAPQDLSVSEAVEAEVEVETEKISVDQTHSEDINSKDLAENVQRTPTGTSDLSTAGVADGSRTQKPKKKKRRQQGSAIGGSLQALLHGGVPKEDNSQSDSSIASEESDSKRRNRKRKTIGAKGQKNRDKYKVYINDEAEEDEGEDEISDEAQDHPTRRRKETSSSEDEDEDEEGYDELRDFIADETEEDAVDEPLIYRGPHTFPPTGSEEAEVSGQTLGVGAAQESSEDDDDDEILRAGLEEDDLALIEENTGIRLNKDSQKHRLKRVSESHELSNKTLVGKNIGDLEDLLFNTGADGTEIDNLEGSLASKQRVLDSSQRFDSEESEDPDDWMVDDFNEKAIPGDEYNMIQSVFGDYDTVMDILMNKVSKQKDPAENLEFPNDLEDSGYLKSSASHKKSETGKSSTSLDQETNIVDNTEEDLFGEGIEAEEGEVGHLREKMKKTTLQTISEPAELHGQFLTDFDTEVKNTDIPERLYLLYGTRWKSLKKRKIDREELQQEALWISRKFLQIYPELFKEDFLRRTHNIEFKNSFPFVSNGGVIQIVSNAVFLVLDWLLNERLDLPYISLHKMHLIRPPLNDFLLGKIVFLDSVYYKLKLSIEGFQRKLLNIREKKSISDIFGSIESQELPEDENLQAFFTVSGLQETLQQSDNFDSSRDVDDIRLYFMYHLDTPRFAQIENFTLEDVTGNHTGDVDDGHFSTGNLGKKLRKNLILELFEFIESNGLFKAWSAHIVSPYILSLYLKSFTSPQFHCSVPTGSVPGLPSTFSFLPPVGPVLDNSKSALLKWFEKYVRQENPMFGTPEKVLESLIIYEAKRLATFPPIRQKLFEYFLSNACITTVTTPKGERTSTPNGIFWLARRLFRKPVNTLLPGTYLPLNEETASGSQGSPNTGIFDGCLSSEIFELERRGMIEIIVHPLCIDDPAPWRGADGESKIKERFLHEIGLLESGIEFQVSSAQKVSLQGPILNRFDQEIRMYVSSDNIDNRVVRNALDELKYGYVSVSGSIWSKLVQVPILHRLVEKELFPTFRVEVLNYLKSRSQEYISELCSLNLEKRLTMLPPKRPEKYERDDSQSNGPDNPRENKSFLLDVDGSESDSDLDYSKRVLDSDDERFFSKSRFSRRRGSIPGGELQLPRDYNTNWGLKIISCVVEKAQNGFKVCVVSLDIFGELRDFLVLDHLLSISSHGSRVSDQRNGDKDVSASLESQRFDDDLGNLIKFAKLYYPHYVCIGISDRKSLDLGGLWNHVLKKAKRKDHKYSPGILFVSMDVSRALVRRSSSESKSSETRRAKGMVSEYPTSVCLAISVGRLVQNPLAEQLQLWEDVGDEVERELCPTILDKEGELVIADPLSSTTRNDNFNPIACLRLHRFQDTVDSKLLQFHLLLAIRSAVASMGVQINRMKGHPHLQSPLKFVSGLGPRKAKFLASFLDSYQGTITNRSQLKLEDMDAPPKHRKEFLGDYYDFESRDNDHIGGCLTKNVFLNAQVFLRVDEEGANEKEFNKGLNIFDISRLSDVDDRELVLTILGNIQDQGPEEQSSGGRQKSKERDETLLWTWISKRSSKLETLDLEAYSKLMYENQDRPRLLPYLNRMLRELKRPYDCSFISREFRGVDKSKQLRESFGISKEDLFVGCEITCRVSGVFANYRGGPSRSGPISLWFDQYNMKVILEDFDSFWEELLDEFPRLHSISMDMIFKPNTPLQAVVTNVDFSQHCIFVALSQSKICNILNYLIDGVWRQQQYRLEMLEKHRVEGNQSGSQSQTHPSSREGSFALKGNSLQEYFKNDFNILQDDLSSLVWSDIRHFSYILFKKNLNVLSTVSGIDLKSGSNNDKSLGDRSWERDSRMDHKHPGAVLRTIHHPNFRSWSHEEVVEHMKNKSVALGEVVIKASNRYIDKLNMYVKVSEDPFMFKVFTIDESDQRLPGELGRRLRIDDSEFNDIDQILIQYVHPLKVHLSNVFGHPKYRSNMEYQNLVTELLVESSTSGNSIVWGITVDRQIPCRFHLISVPPNSRVGSSGARIHFEDGIYVNHKGFQLWRKSENTLRKLLNWWKTDGFFRRSQYLEDYKKYKEHMVRQKQSKGGGTEDDFNWRKSHSSHQYHSGGGGSNSISCHYYNRHHQGNDGFNHNQVTHKSGTGVFQLESRPQSTGPGSYRKSFHGYPPPVEQGSHHNYHPPPPPPPPHPPHHYYPPMGSDEYESTFSGSHRHSRR
ncbi:mRNA transport factor [Cryptosporidium felis]|nr:mRNA transport factor [Cryptosporidium felis]